MGGVIIGGGLFAIAIIAAVLKGLVSMNDEVVSNGVNQTPSGWKATGTTSQDVQRILDEINQKDD